MNDKIQIWKIYSYVSSRLASQSNTGNIVGEFAEELMADYYGGLLAPPSTKGYDFEVNGIKYQVKSRMVTKNNSFTGNLSDIHCWDFDFLIVVFFDKLGSINMVKELTLQEAKDISNGGQTRHLISVSSIRKNNSYNDITQNVKAKYGL